MKLLVLALAAQAATAHGSLGIGLDVLPVAYTFAANRLHFAPDLRLTTCDRTSCRWAAGHGVEVSAYVNGWGLDIQRIEVSTSGGDRGWFENSCLTLVALTLSNANRAEIGAIARSISQEGTAEKDVAGVRFYGSATRGKPGMSCGAVMQ